MRRKKGSILMIGGLLLFAAALSFSVYNIWCGQRAAVASKETVQQLNQLIPDRKTGPEQTAEEIPAYVLNPEMEMPVIQVDGRDYIGTIEIPSLALSLPVMSQWNHPGLRISPCRFSGSAYQNDLIIAAHNYTRHFGSLKTLNVGDAVLFTDADGNAFSYRVSSIEQLGADEIEGLESGDWALTLFTCTLDGQHRITVRCAAA